MQRGKRRKDVGGEASSVDDQARRETGGGEDGGREACLRFATKIPHRPVRLDSRTPTHTMWQRSRLSVSAPVYPLSRQLAGPSARDVIGGSMPQVEGRAQGRF